jgi:hypothetical protein
VADVYDALSSKRVYKAAERPPLSLAPIPDFGLAKLKRYSAMSVQYSRGCPFSCEFCDIIEIYGRVPRTKSNQQILAEFDALRSLGWRGTVFIVDDNFIGNKKNVRQLMPALSEWQKKNGFPFSLLTEASVNPADDEELLSHMHEANFRRVPGVETPVRRVSRGAKDTESRQPARLGEANRNYGMEVMAGFIVGFDNDPADIFNVRSILFERDTAGNGGHAKRPSRYSTWKRLEEGRLLGEASGNNTVSTVNFVPKMDLDLLVSGYHSIMRTIYKPSEYYQRVLNSLRETSTVQPEVLNYTLLRAIASLSHIFFKLGVLDRERREFCALWSGP